MSHVIANPTFRTKSRIFAPIKWFLNLDQAYCAARQLKSTAHHHLKDMGIIRSKANDAFYTQYSENRWDTRDR